MMTPAFDIFLIESEEVPQWLEAVSTFAEAERRAREFAKMTRTLYLIFDQKTQQKHIVDTLTPGDRV
jgi:hypothetical protein